MHEKFKAEQKYYTIKTNYKELLKQLKEADVDVDALIDEINTSDNETLNTVMQAREKFELDWKFI